MDIEVPKVGRLVPLASDDAGVIVVFVEDVNAIVVKVYLVIFVAESGNRNK